MLTENQRLRGLVEGFSPSVSVECAQTPPSSWYTDPAIAELERTSVFRQHWLTEPCKHYVFAFMEFLRCVEPELTPSGGLESLLKCV